MSKLLSSECGVWFLSQESHVKYQKHQKIENRKYKSLNKETLVTVKSDQTVQHVLLILSANIGIQR